MTDAVKPIPEGYHVVTPYLIIKGAAEAIEFYKTAFGAQELVRMPMPDGKIGHAEIKIGDSILMLGEEMEEMGFRSPQALGGCPGSGADRGGAVRIDRGAHDGDDRVAGGAIVDGEHHLASELAGRDLVLS